MKTYKFEIILTEEMLEGDEFWENIIEEDSSGISGMMESMKEAIQDKFFGYPSEKINEIVKLTEYKDK